jgi:DNA polymerase-1
VDKFGRTGGVVYPDGRIHTKFNDLFTTTGRLSSDDPNMQNFPKRKDAWIRALVVPPKGCVMVSSDYGQIEYRVIGIAANDKYIQQTLRDRYDVHMDWAERVAKADPRVYKAFNKDIKKLRSEIKNTWVFPAFYGAHADYIARMLNMDIRAARDLFEVFWEEFAGVHAWQRKLLKQYERTGYVSCLTGRRRRAPMSKNMIYNSPIQGSASDIVVDAMCRLSLRAERDDEPALTPVLNIHDDITFCVPKKREGELIPIIVDEMLHPSFDWVTVPISVEVSSGPNWADMKAIGTYFSDELQ